VAFQHAEPRTEMEGSTAGAALHPDDQRERAYEAAGKFAQTERSLTSSLVGLQYGCAQ
jgi:hypothetical protein